MSKKLFNKDIPKKCAYCIFAETELSDFKILCSKKGPINHDDYCGKYKYNPLLRVPSKKIKGPAFKAEDFSL